MTYVAQADAHGGRRIPEVLMAQAQTPPRPDAAAVGRGLSRRALGTPALVFMIIAAAAPLTVVAGVVPTNYAVTAFIDLPLVFILLGICLVLFAVGYAAMSVHVRSAGAFYTYIARGLGRPAGLGASWLALVTYGGMQPGFYAMLGFTTSSLLSNRLGVDLPWWLFGLIGWLVVGVLGVNKVDLSARIVGVLVALEFVVVVVFDGIALAIHPEGFSTVSLAPSHLFDSGIGAALALSVAAFMGFESAAIYGEEAKDPKRSIARATFIAVGIIAVFYAVAAWATTIGTGPSAVVKQSQAVGPDLMFQILAAHGGIVLADLGQVLLITSLLAGAIAFHNIVARYGFSLGREGVIPRVFGRVSGRSGAPLVGSLGQSGIALIILVAFAVAGSGSELGPLFPVLTMFTWLGGMGAFGVVILLVLTSLAVIGYFARDPRGYSVWTRLIAPGLAALALAAIFVLIVVNFDILIGAEGASVLTWVLPAIVLVAGVLGVLWAFWLRANRPMVYLGIGRGAEQPTSGTADTMAAAAPAAPRRD